MAGNKSQRVLRPEHFIRAARYNGPLQLALPRRVGAPFMCIYIPTRYDIHITTTQATPGVASVENNTWAEKAALSDHSLTSGHPDS